MGGKSSSKNQTTSTNVSGQNAISGDNLGTAISGVNNSTLNVTATDYGSVSKALDLGGEIVEQSGQMFDNALSYAGQVNQDSLDFADNALEDITASNSENLQMMAGLAGNQAEQNTKNLNAIMDLAKFKQDGGVSASNKQQIILMAVVALVLGGVAYMAVKK
ncbi:chemotaxis protein [Vibrio sp. AK197]